jgi:hypothetical protein
MTTTTDVIDRSMNLRSLVEKAAPVRGRYAEA